MRYPSLATLSTTLLFCVPGSLLAQDAAKKPQHNARILEALQSVSEDARIFNEHIVFLSSDYLQGRLPGTPGMKIAKDYMVHHMRKAGLQPPFAGKDNNKSWLQGFPHGGKRVLKGESLSLPKGDQKFVTGKDYVAMIGGDSGSVTGEVVCVGYSVRQGPDDYSSYPDDDDLTGKIALVFRFEPMDENGKSLWAPGRRPWTSRAQFKRKVIAAIRHNAAGIIIVNTPGANDPRKTELSRGGSASLTGNRKTKVPVLLVSAKAGRRLVDSLSGGNHKLNDLKAKADREGGVTFLGGKATISAKIETERLYAENVAGLLPGRGALKNELIVFGAHLDHLGLGAFGSRDARNRGKKVHPGADDNASGAAAILMIASKMAKAYATAPKDQPMRSVLFMGFSAEESGLHGARYYVNHQLPFKHALMINFDMVGRVQNGRLSVGGSDTAAGMREWVKKICDASPLRVALNKGGTGGSDHQEFYRKRIPVLMGNSGIHADYHTTRDNADRINREGGAMVAQLFAKIGLAAAARTAPFEFRQVQRQPRRR